VLRLGYNCSAPFSLRIKSAAHAPLDSPNHRRDIGLSRGKVSKAKNIKSRDNTASIHLSTSLSEALQTQLQTIKVLIPGFALDRFAPETLELLQINVEQMLAMTKGVDVVPDDQSLRQRATGGGNGLLGASKCC